jgi:hypothetical protein
MHVLILVIIGYLLFHGGHSHANYRHGRARKYGRVRLYWSSFAGPYASVRVGKWRIGHKL